MFQRTRSSRTSTATTISSRRSTFQRTRSSRYFTAPTTTPINVALMLSANTSLVTALSLLPQPVHVARCFSEEYEAHVPSTAPQRLAFPRRGRTSLTSVDVSKNTKLTHPSGRRATIISSRRAGLSGEHVAHDSSATTTGLTPPDVPEEEYEAHAVLLGATTISSHVAGRPKNTKARDPLLQQ